MNDTISRQDAIKAIEDLPNCYNGFSDTYDKACIIGALEELPSAEPEIIRCKDCKHWKHSTIIPNYCDVWDWCNRADDFCSFAERREE